MTGRARAAITGLGVRTPAGNDLKSFWAALLDGRSTARTITSFDVTGLPVDFACQVPGFDTAPYVTARLARRMDPATLLAVCAADDALADAAPERVPGEGQGDGQGGGQGGGSGDRPGEGPSWVPPERRAVVTGTGLGGNATVEAALLGHDRHGGPSALHVPRVMHNAAAAFISMRHRLLGPSLTLSTACASGGHAIGEGLRLLRDGSADLVVAGGTEACVSATVLLAFHRCGALSQRVAEPERASRPFDAARDGFVLAEGAAFVVLERLEDAVRRGARVYAELAGYGRTSDAHHLTSPEPGGGGAERCVRQALADARLSPGEVVHVNAHGSGTDLNDVTEADVIARLFGRVPVTSTKGVLGHAIGAAGAIEAVAGALTLHERVMPPTANLDVQDPRCDIEVVRRPRPLPPGAVLSNSFAFGGHNASLVLTPA
ncbi:beta-ketoacyl-[acyl-carrier-protein] synthase family protein [Actinomadura sp. ATCC 31491]|uniref:Beta-ketoacyl-[acyl-carrier-protein] synthase family protein n=1 Tax=Actinomadura luzonensis TaxID=2805427 RepID=A0ABT0GBN4_9ACTN|nr:beta-ketoacyl-[acyl-carrier-protein] synthase family protein [Actinomadura luzonensis]MCK2221976.1 beta-ketoacyl-[acyl-carrier-protein] synthase family protein [Actinomadura luzonensis]